MLQVISVFSNIVAYQLSSIFSSSLWKSRHPLSGWLVDIPWHFNLELAPGFALLTLPCTREPRAGLGVAGCWFCFQRGNLLLGPVCVLPSSCTGGWNWISLLKRLFTGSISTKTLAALQSASLLSLVLIYCHYRWD